MFTPVKTIADPSLGQPVDPVRQTGAKSVTLGAIAITSAAVAADSGPVVIYSELRAVAGVPLAAMQTRSGIETSISGGRTTLARAA